MLADTDRNDAQVPDTGASKEEHAIYPVLNEGNTEIDDEQSAECTEPVLME